jgi:hypothetical protein
MCSPKPISARRELLAEIKVVLVRALFQVLVRLRLLSGNQATETRIHFASYR